MRERERGGVGLRGYVIDFGHRVKDSLSHFLSIRRPGTNCKVAFTSMYIDRYQDRSGP